MSNEGELALRNRFRQLVENDFQVLPDVVGKNLIYGIKVIIDFMLYPKSHLLKAGFDPVWFGVEVKHFGVSGETGKMSRFVWQCITYVQSEFQIDSTTVRPVFVLGFSDIDEVNRDIDSLALCQWTGMQRLAGLAKVGTFYEIPPTSNNRMGGWRIRFSSSTYFFLSKGQYHRLKTTTFTKKMLATVHRSCLILHRSRPTSG